MALTKDQWAAKLKGMVPSWWFESEQYQDAVFQGLAAVIAEVELEAEAYFDGTFITRAVAPTLDAHGDERSLARLPNEQNLPYSNRIRHIIDQSNIPAITAIVNALLVRGTCEIREGYKDLTFANRGNFLSRDEFLTDYHYNFFTILVDPQLAPTNVFLGRSTFAGRGNYLAGPSDTSGVYASIVEAVNKAKAFGVLYRIVER